MMYKDDKNSLGSGRTAKGANGRANYDAIFERNKKIYSLVKSQREKTWIDQNSIDHNIQIKNEENQYRDTEQLLESGLKMNSSQTLGHADYQFKKSRAHLDCRKQPRK